MTEYIKRESDIEAIMSDQPDAHYPHWYADKIKAIPAADVAPVQEWIPVKDRLPESGKEGVLIALLWGGVDIGWCEDGRWCSEFVNEYEDGEVTHWMPLPKPPKGE